MSSYLIHCSFKLRHFCYVYACWPLYSRVFSLDGQKLRLLERMRQMPILSSWLGLNQSWPGYQRFESLQALLTLAVSNSYILLLVQWVNRGTTAAYGIRPTMCILNITPCGPNLEDLQIKIQTRKCTESGYFEKNPLFNFHLNELKHRVWRIRCVTVELLSQIFCYVEVLNRILQTVFLSLFLFRYRPFVPHIPFDFYVVSK